jgi:hypothetical protein
MKVLGVEERVEDVSLKRMRSARLNEVIETLQQTASRSDP